MKRFFSLCIALLSACAAFAQAEKSIIIDASKFRPVQTDALTGVNIDPIGVDYSKRPCARLKIKINRMTVEEINGIEVKVATNNAVMKCQTAQYDTGLIVEMTAKPNTRFYFHHNEFGDSNEVCLNLEPNKEYYLEAYLNQQYPITVAANVAGADVYLDGVYKGQTDANYVLTVKDVIPGEHTLRVELGGIKQEQKIVVSASSVFFRQTINTQATKPQFVVFSVEPQSAVVTIEGKHHPAQDGFVQLVLQNGNYNYSVSAVGYHTQSGNFTVAGAKVEKEVKLMADAANVTITAPDGAEIWVNGSKKGTSSWSGTLSSGTYIFEARKSGHQSVSISANISSSQPNSHFTLPAPTPIVGSLVVMSAPAMAEVAIDGKVVGRTPLDLGDVLVGEHTVTISKEGYVSKTQKVTLAEGKTEVVNVALVKQSTTPTSTSTSTTSAKGITYAPYKVGDYYNDGTKEGVVFEVSADGLVGKIVSMIQSDKLQWFSDAYHKSDDFWAKREVSGAIDMIIVKAEKDWQKKFPAFKWCADLGEGWYLPAVKELTKFINDDATHEAVNHTLTSKGGVKLYNPGEKKYYWSSTAHFELLAAIEPRLFTYSEFDHKYNKHFVRAVATFDYSPTPTPGRTSAPYKVGDYYNDGTKEGVVFEVSADGMHGKIVSMKSSQPMDWAEDKRESKRLINATYSTDGEQNMARVKKIAGWQKKYPVFKWCADLGEGWYLPAIEELKKFMLDEVTHNAVFRTIKARGGTIPKYVGYPAAYYWSSTESSKIYTDGNCYARSINLRYMKEDYSMKESNIHAYAVAKF